MMKIALLYSLLIYQLLQHCDATGNGAECRPLPLVRAGTIEATIVHKLGSSIEIHSPENHCNHPNSNDYVLLRENDHTGELDIISQQEGYTFTISNVQLNTSAIYCTYKQCAPEEKEQCCIRIAVLPKIELIFPDSVPMHTQQSGACYIRAWPMLTTDDIDVYTDDGCAITKHPVSDESTNITAILFTLDNITGSCQRISCFTQFKEQMKYINIAPTHVSGSIPTGGYTPIPELGGTVPDEADGGVLGIYRITLWIIVLTLTIFSTAMTSLTPGFT